MGLRVDDSSEEARRLFVAGEGNGLEDPGRRLEDRLETEAGTRPVRPVTDAHRTMHGGGQFRNHGQTQARAAEATGVRGVDVTELLEDPRPRLGRNTGPGVVDDEGEPRGLVSAADALDRDADQAARRLSIAASIVC